MKEFFYVTVSFAAPFFSDTDTGFCKATDPKEAINKVFKNYNHPAGLYFASIYGSSNDYHKNKDPLTTYYSGKAWITTHGITCLKCNGHQILSISNCSKNNEHTNGNFDYYQCENKKCKNGTFIAHEDYKEMENGRYSRY